MSQSDQDAVSYSENRLWVWGGLPLFAASFVLLVTTQHGPLLHSTAADLSPVHAGYFGTILIGIATALFNLLVAIPIVTRRRRRFQTGANGAAAGPMMRLPLPLTDSLPGVPDGNYRQSPPHRLLIGLAAFGFAFLPAAFTVHGLKVTVYRGEIWTTEETEKALAGLPMHGACITDDEARAVSECAEREKAWLEQLKARVLGPTTITPLDLFESCSPGPHGRPPWLPFWLTAPTCRCDEGTVRAVPGFVSRAWRAPSKDHNTLLLASGEGDIIRYLTGLSSEQLNITMTTGCLRNRHACKGVDLWPQRLVLWYNLIGIPSMLAVASALWFWILVFWPLPASPLRRLLSLVGPDPGEKTGRGNGRPKRLRPRLLLLSALLLAVSVGLSGRLSSASNLPAYFIPGVLLLLLGAALCPADWRRAAARTLAIGAIAALVGIALGETDFKVSEVSRDHLLILLLIPALILAAGWWLVRRGNQAIDELYDPRPFASPSASRTAEVTPGAGDPGGSGPAIDEAAAFEERVTRLVQGLREAAGLATMPQLVRLDGTDQPIAFSTGWHGNSKIAVSLALASLLDDSEPARDIGSAGLRGTDGTGASGDERLKAILAHEVAHIVNGDSGKRVRINGLTGVIGGLALASSAIQGGNAGPASALPKIGRGIAGMLSIGVLSFLLPALRAGASQAREFAADRRAAELCGGAGGLIAALRRLEVWQGATEGQTRARQPLLPIAHLLVVPPAHDEVCGGIFRSHPDIAERIVRLEEQERARRSRVDG